MIFVWSVESALLALIQFGLTDYVPLNFWFVAGQLILALVALVFHTTALALALDLHNMISCNYLAALIGLYAAMANFSLSVISMIELSFGCVLAFTAIATIFASTSGATPMMFDRLGQMLLLVGLYLRTPVHVALDVGLGVMLAVFALLGLYERKFSVFCNIGAAVAYLVLVVFMNDGLVHIGYAAAVAASAVLWGLEYFVAGPEEPEKPPYDPFGAGIKWPEVTIKKGV